MGPLRCRKTGDNAKAVALAQVSRDTHLIVIACGRLDLQFKVIQDLFRSQMDRCLVKIKSALHLREVHFLPHGSADQIHRVHIILHCAQTDGYVIVFLRLCRSPVVAGLIAEDRSLPKNGTHQ